MNKLVIALTLCAVTLLVPAHAFAFSCTATGTTLRKANVTKGKIGPYRAYEKNHSICVLAAGKCSYIKPNGKVYRHGKAIGRIKCSYSKLLNAIKG